MEQEFLERCFQEMLDEEDQDWFIPARDLPSGVGQLQQQLNGLSVNDSNAEDIAVSFKTLAMLIQFTARLLSQLGARCPKVFPNVVQAHQSVAA